MEERGEGLGLFCSPKLPFFSEHNVSLNFVADYSFKRHFLAKSPKGNRSIEISNTY